MIRVTRLNGTPVTINAELIEAIEGSSDTTIHLATGNRFVVRERPEEVERLVVEYRRKVNAERPVSNPIQGFERHGG